MANADKIQNIRLSQFMKAIGGQPVKAEGYFKYYYNPRRDSDKPTLVIDELNNKWHDKTYGGSGGILELAYLTYPGDSRCDVVDYILNRMAFYKMGLSEYGESQHGFDFHNDECKVPLTDFMKALGQDTPVISGNPLKVYLAPYSENKKATMVVNVSNNRWKDISTNAYGGIYDLAYELTGLCKISDLKKFISDTISCLHNVDDQKKLNTSLPDKSAGSNRITRNVNAKYSVDDLPHLRMTQFLDSLGVKPVEENNGYKLYYAPYRDDPKPMLTVNDNLNIWHDKATNEMGNLHDLAVLTARGDNRNDITGYIIDSMNEYANRQEQSAMARCPQEPTVISLDIKKVKLTDFMKALGQGHPVAADGNLRIYNAPYDVKPGPTMIINTETNLWRDTKSGAYGGIYDLAYELTGSCNMSELNQYIAGQMSGMDKSQKVEPPKQEQEPDKPKRKMRL